MLVLGLEFLGTGLVFGLSLSVYGVGALDGFGNFSRAELAAAGALVDYIGLTQQGKTPHLEPPQRVMPGSVMQIDAATRGNLELATTLAGERRGSLLATIDRTVTGPGPGFSPNYLTAPLTAPAAIWRGSMQSSSSSTGRTGRDGARAAPSVPGH